MMHQHLFQQSVTHTYIVCVCVLQLNIFYREAAKKNIGLLSTMTINKPFGDAGGYRWLVKEGRGVERGRKYTGA
jgi:hypothetical protein